ncbi:serine protease inhibitor Kazal-type 5-like [Hemicordylus capensis]|uniref:serine protease inhibitor Kazal-type 5-like n=1 Tax=Hemicordylus capensis TaxID=884348 RepID=UPI0023028581|nr:serine protease inhibitor Kazal-type 5-like [Hemicordylus capensis]
MKRKCGFDVCSQSATSHSPGNYGKLAPRCTLKPLYVASQARYKEGMCLEFRHLVHGGNLYCSRDIDPIIGPDGRTHTNKCVMCREVLHIPSFISMAETPWLRQILQHITPRTERTKRGFIADYGSNSYGSSSGWPNESSSEKDDGCGEYWPYFKKGIFSCTRENDPVRDATGKQHGNKCIMCAEKFKNGGKMNSLEKNQAQYGKNERDDECYEYRSQMRPDGGLSCTRENAPVRDATGQTHSNKCLMCANKFKKEVREGKIGGGGPYGNRIIQGNSNQGNRNENNCNQFGRSQQQNNGNNVNNPCTGEQRIAPGDYRSHANCGGTEESTQYNVNCGRPSFNDRRKRKAVEEKLDCIKILADLKEEGTTCNALRSPVCGTDGKTYNNICFLCSEIVRTEDALTLKLEGECPEVVGEKVNCSKYPQTRGRVLCKRNTQEVCGTDGETHLNECMLCDRILKTKSEIGIKNIGPCPKCIVGFLEVGLHFPASRWLCHSWQHGSCERTSSALRVAEDTTRIIWVEGVDSSDGGTEVNCDRYLRIVIGNTESIACPSIHKRICATDGKTYANECEICKHNLNRERRKDNYISSVINYNEYMRNYTTIKTTSILMITIRKTLAIMWPHRKARVKLTAGHVEDGILSVDGDEIDCSQYLSEPGTEVRGCNRMYKPICGDDGNTYANECEMCQLTLALNKNVGKQHEGKCSKGEEEGLSFQPLEELEKAPVPEIPAADIP